VIRIACTALGKRIKAGKVSKDGKDFVGNPQDVTSDCLKAVIDFVEPGRRVIVHENGVPAYSIDVLRVLAPKENPKTQ
jgi:hypothetical protein